MKRSTLLLALAGSALVLGATMLSAQSLGEVARQERAKRQREAKVPVKLYTNDNIPRAENIAEKSEGETAKIAGTEEPAATGEKRGEPQPQEGGATGAGKAEAPKAAGEKAEDKKKSKDYWQEKFAAARAQLARAEEERQLAENEFTLLQTKQARELVPQAQADLTNQVNAKAAEVKQKRDAVDKARKALEDLQKEFDQSGAPAEWSKTE